MSDIEFLHYFKFPRDFFKFFLMGYLKVKVSHVAEKYPNNKSIGLLIEQ